MKSFKSIITDPIGIHARPASVIAKEASKYTSKITVNFNGKSANLKSVLNLMALIIKHNSEIEVVADGTDEENAIYNIEKAMKDAKIIG